MIWNNQMCITAEDKLSAHVTIWFIFIRLYIDVFILIFSFMPSSMNLQAINICCFPKHISAQNSYSLFHHRSDNVVAKGIMKGITIFSRSYIYFLKTINPISERNGETKSYYWIIWAAEGREKNPKKEPRISDIKYVVRHD